MTLASCGAHDLSNVNAALLNVPHGMQSYVKNKCKAMGYPVPE